MGTAQPDITISLPIYVRLGKKLADRFSLNLNVYRNAHFHILSNAKVKFEKLIAYDIASLPVIAKADLTYSLFFGSKRAIDISNICCIVDKFFCDTLVNQKKLLDDNMDTISNINYRWGGVDKLNPRVEVTLSNIIREKETMQIILTQQEIKDAIRETVLQQITIREDQGIAISFEGVKDGGLTVHVTIQKADEVAPKKVRTRKTTQSTEEPVEEPAKAHVVPEELTLGQKPISSTEIITQAKEAIVTTAPRTSAIFPDVNSSAPVTEPATPPPAKSLFGNLTKPVHDAKE